MATKPLNLKDVLLSSRPFWWITTAAPFVVGYLTAGLYFRGPLLIGIVYFLFPYNLFLYGINDIFDYQSDIRNPRKAGIEGAVLDKHKHLPLFWVILVTNVPYWFYFFSIGNRPADGWLVAMILLALAYSVKGFRFKEVPLLDSLTSSFHYTSPFLFGVLLASGRFKWLLGFIAFFVWAVANHAFGAIQDIEPDRQAGIQSIATKLGSKRTLWFCLITYSIAALLPILFFGLPAIFITIVLLSYVWLAVRIMMHKKKADYAVFHRAWQQLTYLNYINGFLVSLYLILLYKAGH